MSFVTITHQTLLVGPRRTGRVRADDWTCHVYYPHPSHLRRDRIAPKATVFFPGFYRGLWCWVMALLVGSGAMVGCENHAMRRLDDEVGRMIQERERQTMGQHAQLDAQPIPPRALGQITTSRSYDMEPATRTPSPSDWPTLDPATTQPRITQPASNTTTAPASTTRPTTDTQPAATQPGYSALQTPAILENASQEMNGAVAMRLEALLAYAVQNGREYRNRKETLFLAALNLLIERHQWGPRFINSFTTQFTGTPEPGDYDHAMELLGSLGVTQRLPYGGSISATALVNYVSMLGTASNSGSEDSQNAAIQLAATLPLWRGAGESAREDLIQAERNLIYATRSFNRYRQEYLVDVSTRYYDLLQQQSQIDNLHRQVANFEWLSRRISALARAGREPVFEVQRAEQQVLFARNNLLNSQERYAAALDAFKLFIGMEVRHRLVILPSEVVVPNLMVDPAKAVQSALNFRLDLQNVNDQVDDSKRKVEVARNQLQPDLNLFANVNVPTDPSKQFGSVNVDPKFGTYTAGVTYSLPIDRRVEELKLRQALIELERSQRNYSLQRDQTALQVRRSIRQMEQARFTLDLQNRNIEVAEKRLRGVLLRLRDLGPRDFIEAQSDLLEARNRRDGALRDMRVNILQFLLDSGLLRVSEKGQWLSPGQTTEIPLIPESLVSDAGKLMEQISAQQESSEDGSTPKVPGVIPGVLPGVLPGAGSVTTQPGIAVPSTP